MYRFAYDSIGVMMFLNLRRRRYSRNYRLQNVKGSKMKKKSVSNKMPHDTVYNASFHTLFGVGRHFSLQTPQSFHPDWTFDVTEGLFVCKGAILVEAFLFILILILSILFCSLLASLEVSPEAEAFYNMRAIQ